MAEKKEKRMIVGVTPAAAVILQTLEDGYKTIFVSQAIEDYAGSEGGKYLLERWKKEEKT